MADNAKAMMIGNRNIRGSVRAAHAKVPACSPRCCPRVLLPLGVRFATLVLVALFCHASARDDTAAQISKIYARLDLAFLTNNVRLAEKALAPDFLNRDVDGIVQTRKAFLADQFAPDPSAKTVRFQTEIRFVELGLNKAVVEAVSLGVDRHTSPFSRRSRTQVGKNRSRDTWVRRAGRWLMVRSTDLEDIEWTDGREIAHSVFPELPAPRRLTAILRELRANVVSLRSAVPVRDDSDLEALPRSIGAARLVGMGEASHGTSEFFTIKDRIFRYLVEHMGFTVLAMEADLGDGVAIERYLATGRGNPEGHLATVWDNQEVLELLHWMRAYNIQGGKHPMLHFVGIDMVDPFASLALVIFHDFGKHPPVTTHQLIADYVCLIADYDDEAFAKLSSARKLACVAGAWDAYQRIASSSASIDVKRAAFVVLENMANRLSMDSDSERDRTMARNVKWVADSRYPHAKIVLWAHNAHVAAYPMTGGSQLPMGAFLRDRFASQYYAIGFSFDRGSISSNGIAEPVALGPAPLGSSESVFRKIGPAMFLLDLHRAQQGADARQWLSKPLQITDLGAPELGIKHVNPAALEREREDQTVLPKAFDSLIFVRESHAAHSFHLR